MPTDSEGLLNPGTADNTSSGYRSKFSHENEEAHPGYYKVLLLILDLDAGIYDYLETRFIQNQVLAF